MKVFGEMQMWKHKFKSFYHEPLQNTLENNKKITKSQRKQQKNYKSLKTNKKIYKTKKTIKKRERMKHDLLSILELISLKNKK